MGLETRKNSTAALFATTFMLFTTTDPCLAEPGLFKEIGVNTTAAEAYSRVEESEQIHCDRMDIFNFGDNKIGNIEVNAQNFSTALLKGIIEKELGIDMELMGDATDRIRLENCGDFVSLSTISQELSTAPTYRALIRLKDFRDYYLATHHGDAVSGIEFPRYLLSY